jgi:hypothetical protein
MRWDDGLRHDRNSLYLSTDPQPAAGDGAALVVSQPFPRLAWKAAMPGVSRFLKLPTEAPLSISIS